MSRDDSDFSKLFDIAKHFAMEGRSVTLVPKMRRPQVFEYYSIYGALVGTPFEGKCPDMFVDGKWYEYEGFITKNPKRAFSNMLNRGLKQSDRLIIEKPNLSEAYIKRVIYQRIREGQMIREIIIWNGEKLELVYKKFEG